MPTAGRCSHATSPQTYSSAGGSGISDRSGGERGSSGKSTAGPGPAGGVRNSRPGAGGPGGGGGGGGEPVELIQNLVPGGGRHGADRARRGAAEARQRRDGAGRSVH